MSEQKYLETLYLCKDKDECWFIKCRDCASEFGKEHGLEWNTYPFMPEMMDTPNGVATPEGEIAAEVYAPEIYESDTPTSCDDCDTWLVCSLTKDGVEYLLDEVNEFPKDVIALYLGDD